MGTLTTVFVEQTKIIFFFIEKKLSKAFHKETFMSDSMTNPFRVYYVIEGIIKCDS